MIRPIDYGAEVDGIADDLEPIEDAIAAWLGSANPHRPGELVLSGSYSIGVGGATIAPTQNVVGGRIIGYGARLISPGGAALTFDTVTNGKLWRNLTIEGLALDGGGIVLKGGAGAAGLYGWTLQNVDVENFDGHGIVIDGGFEGAINCCHLSAPGNTTGDCLRVVNGVGNTSSVDVRDCSTRFGLHGLYSNAGDCDVVGGTFLEAQEEGIRMVNAIGSTVNHAHVENCWQSAASQSAGGAGVMVSGRATVQAVRAVDTHSKMKWGVRVFSAGGKSVVQGGVGSGLVDYLRVEGQASGEVYSLAVPSVDVDAGFSGHTAVA